MNIIKLNATESTNQYLKDLGKKLDLENFTIVCADKQTKGKGQMGATWFSEAGKNLTMSILVKDLIVKNSQIFDLNVVVACSIFNVLKSLNIANLSIKWPNDMMAGNKKIGGILIENSITSARIVSIVGIGINVNQHDFIGLPQASSLHNVTHSEFDVQQLMLLMGTEIEKNCRMITQETVKNFWTIYHENLFKKNVPMVFENVLGSRFNGMIQKVEDNGQLTIMLEDDRFAGFGVKEVKMLY